MIHTNPFTPTGYELSELKREIQQKADRHETTSLRGTMDSLERTLRELSTEIIELRSRNERLEEAVRDLNPGVNI